MSGGREAWREGWPIWWALWDDVLADAGMQTISELWDAACNRTPPGDPS